MSQLNDEELGSGFYKSSLLFLEKNGTLRRFHQALKNSITSKSSLVVLDFSVTVDVGEAFNFSEELATRLLEFPFECQTFFQELLFCLAQRWVSSYSKEGEALVPSLKNSGTLYEYTQVDTDVKLILDSYKSLGSSEENNIRESTDQRLTLVEELFPGFDSHSSFYPDEKNPLEPSEPPKRVLPKEDFSPDFDLVNCDILGGLMSLAAQDSTQIKIFSKSQIQVRLCVEGLPSLVPFRVTGNHGLSTIRRPLIAIVSGLIMGFSMPNRYTFCLSPMTQDPSTRREGEEMTVLLLPDSSSTYNNRHLSIRQCLKLILKDCERRLITLGNRIEASVFLVPSKSNQHPTIFVSTIYPPIPFRRLSHIPQTFRQLLADRSCSTWSLVLTLAYMFCSDISPPGTFFKVKMALLLSLASCSYEESVLAVLVVGKCELIHKRLLEGASRMAPSFVSHSSLDDFEGRAFKTVEGRIWLEAGSLLRAKGGICATEDLSVAKKETKDAICRILEHEEVRLEIPTELKGSFLATAYPLRTCIWSTYNPCGAKRRVTGDDALFLHAYVGDLTKSVTSGFGLVAFSDSATKDEDDEIERFTSSEMLLERQGCGAASTPLLTAEELSQYFQVVRSIRVSFTADAERLLQGYYVTIRRLRGATMPVTAINTLTKIAKCHAKLSLTSIVDVGDAAAAIHLYEEALAASTGLSALGIRHKPHICHPGDVQQFLGPKVNPPDNISKYLEKNGNDERMRNFIHRVDAFINEHTNDINYVFN